MPLMNSWNWRWHPVLWDNWLSYREETNYAQGGRPFDEHVEIFIDGFAKEGNGNPLPLVINTIILTYEGTKWKRPTFNYYPTPPLINCNDDSDEDTV